MTSKLERILPLVQKPARYTGGEYGEIRKDKAAMEVRVAFCFPDTYEIGMSNLGLRILYGVMNQPDWCWCERAFAPWGDMAEQMARHDIPLYALESGDPLSDFDLLGFSLFSAWIAATCGDAHIEDTARQKLMQNCIQIDWKTLHNSYAFAAESALICR